MTETNAAPPAQNLALIKAVTGLLGLMLIGGVALLVILLFTRGEASEGADVLPPLVIAEGEVIASQSASRDAVSFLVTQTDGGARLVVIDLETGRQRVIAIRRPESVTKEAPITDE